jgi:L-alanine-DL-glutamate epimerase-like enolase superfamily enzyme
LENLRLESLSVRPLSVSLIEPFVIATGRVDATRAVEIEVTIAGGAGGRVRRAVGLGEAACLPPVTREDQSDVLAALARVAARLPSPVTLLRSTSVLPSHAPSHPSLDALADGLGPVARAGLDTAIIDALAQLDGLPVRTWLGGPPGPDALETDVTIAIATPEKMAELARGWVARGFRALKVKVGKDLDTDIRALEAIGRAAPSASLRVDANAGYSAQDAIALARACQRLALRVECWEQPCAADDHAGMAEVTAAIDAPVIADESVKTVADVEALLAAPYADGINLKLAKTGSVEAAVRMGRLATTAGLQVMVGGMVETRLGMTAAAHIACAVGGVDFVDLDTAWLLADDPYVGGYEAHGPRYTMPDLPGLGLRRR